MLAIILVVMASSAGCPWGRRGNKKWISGRIRLDALRMIPDLAAISISPIQRDMTPIMVIQRVMASFAESRAAFVISGMVPEKAAKMTPVRIMPAQR